MIDMVIVQLFKILEPILIAMLLVTLGVIITSRRRRSAKNISLWIALGMLCILGLEVSFTYRQFQASEKPSVGTNLKRVNFLKNGNIYQDVINTEGNIPSKMLSPILMVTNYGEKPAFIENISLIFIAKNQQLLLPTLEWKNLPLYSNQTMQLELQRPISNHDFDRIGFANNEVQLLVTTIYRSMFAKVPKYKIIIEYRYLASNESVKLVNSKFSSESGIFPIACNIMKIKTSKEGLMNLFFAFLVSLLASIVAIILTLLIERNRLPHLVLSPQEDSGGYRNYADKGSWKFLRVIVANKKMPWILRWSRIPRQTAENCRAILEFRSLDDNIIFTMRGRWISTPEIPHVSKNAVVERVLHPDPVSILTNHQELLDVIVQQKGDAEAYGWNNESYLNNWKTPHNKLLEGNYKIKISIATQNGVTFSEQFNLRVDKKLEQTLLQLYGS